MPITSVLNDWIAKTRTVLERDGEVTDERALSRLTPPDCVVTQSNTVSLEREAGDDRLSNALMVTIREKSSETKLD